MLASLNQALVDSLRADPRVRLVYLFGSQARGDGRPDSDVDVAVLLAGRPSWDDERQLRAATARLQANVDLVLLNGAPPLLLHEVVTGGRCLYARDPREQAEFEITSLSRFLDFQPVRRIQEQYLRARVEARRGSQNRNPA